MEQLALVSHSESRGSSRIQQPRRLCGGPGEEALGVARLRTCLLQVEGPLGRQANENTHGFYSEVNSRTESDDGRDCRVAV